MADYFVHETSCIDENAMIGEGTSIWCFSHIMDGAVIGRDCHIGQNVFVDRDVKIGDGCKLQNNVSVYSGVVLEDYVFCGPSCVFTNDFTPRAKYPKGRSGYRPTLVKYGATIGANATIVCGNTIGKHAMVAAGAVVTSDVPDYALVVGVPARVVGTVDEKGNIVSKEKCFEQETV